jgi:threonine dehydratase
MKREDLGPTGTFKWRGALTACQAYRDDGVAEIATASTGNHGAAVAWAAERLGMKAHVVVPREVVGQKRDLVTRQGAQLHEVGDDLQEAGAFASELAEERGIPYFADGGSAAQIEGVATVGDELAQAAPDLVFVPVGCGALAAGVGAGLERSGCATQLIGVQSVHFSRIAAEFHNRSYAPTGERTFADGLADDRLIDPAFSACIKSLDDVVTVEEHQLRDAVRILWQRGGIRAEGAGAAALAGYLASEQNASGRVAVVVSGGNLDPELGREILAGPATSSSVTGSASDSSGAAVG